MVCLSSCFPDLNSDATGIPHFRHTLHPPIRISADTAAILRCSKVVIWQVVFTCFHWLHVTVRPLEIWALSQPLYSSSVQILRRYDAEEFNKRVSKSSTQEPERYLNSSKHVQKYEALSSAKQNIQVKECVCVRVLVRCWLSHLTSYKHQPVPPWQVWWHRKWVPPFFPCSFSHDLAAHAHANGTMHVILCSL